ncbi:hypothetical protein QBC37DRAFT_464235 [Rhypophila decipiens]|uniref:Uncharacterized protein n=1 Tax=Rhypophila decipiens TaxID=261697 RepID=A0AAN6Y5U3_9PEZI|nr:hypothetical protein QBC37DRAFT_464235 [Rhypophila decipiens]
MMYARPRSARDFTAHSLGLRDAHFCRNSARFEALVIVVKHRLLSNRFHGLYSVRRQMSGGEGIRLLPRGILVFSEHLWVHVCRKHYQRARYRNAVEYAKLQCTLIRAQIDRVQAWSNANKESGHPDAMKDWSPVEAPECGDVLAGED